MWLIVSVALAGFPFVSHSDGSAGDILVAAGTSLEYPLPADGVIHATSVTVEAGATLTFTPNAANTPVYLLSTGPVLVEGAIDLDGDEVSTPSGGAGGPGGYGGGYNASPSPGYGQGPYGGIGSTAGTSLRTASRAPYVASLLTLIGGSGGGGSSATFAGACGGTGGGGAILVASEVSVTVDGRITASGGQVAASCTTSAGLGAGGAIRVVAPVVQGAGLLTTASLAGVTGEVRVDTARPDLLQGLTEENTSGTPIPLSNIGTTLYVIPPAELPRVRVVSVGSELVADTGGPAYVTLPNGSAQAQTVVVETLGFGDTSVQVRLRAVQPNSLAFPIEQVVTVSSDPVTHLATTTLQFVPSTLTRIDLSAN